MLDELRSRFELHAMAIANLPEVLENQIIEAGQIITQSLLNENHIYCLGLGDGSLAAQIFTDELINSSQLERPSLPCIQLEESSNDEAQLRQLESLLTQGDILVIFQGSRRNVAEEASIHRLSSLISSSNLSAVIVCNQEFPLANSNSMIQIQTNSSSRMNYLGALSVISMTMAALIDHNLFGHPI